MKTRSWSPKLAFGLLSSLGFIEAGCGVGLGNFTDGLELDRCDSTFQVCEAGVGGCILGQGRYIEGTFPGVRQFIVPAPAESVIVVEVFFLEQVASGVDTTITWHEPGCFETYQWSSEGQDIFLLADRDRVLTQGQQVFQDGDHLVEVFSDAIATYQLRVRVDAFAD